jgi:hypothetical protein
LKSRSENLRTRIRKKKNKRDFKRKKEKLLSLLTKKNLKMTVKTIVEVAEEAEVVEVEVIMVVATTMIVLERLRKTPEQTLLMCTVPAQNSKATTMTNCTRLRVALSPRNKSRSKAILSSTKTTTLHYE